MTINDLWHEVDIDHEAVALDQAKRQARRTLTPKVSFLMEASTRAGFEDRLALADEEISRAVREASRDDATYALVRTSVLDDLNEMFERGETQRRRTEAARRARERRSSTHHAATQAEVDSWLARQDPEFAKWATPYAQRMVYGPTYNRSVSTHLPDAARAYKDGGFEGRQFRYVRSQLDAALGSERGESWYWDEAQGEYTQRLDNTMGAKKSSTVSVPTAKTASYYVVRREGTEDPREGPFDSEDEARKALEGYPDEYMVATSEQLGKESRKAAKFVVRQRGTMSGGSDSYNTREEAQSKADALNTEHGTNDYIVSEEGDDKESVKTAAGDLPWSSPPFKGHGFVGFGELCRLCQRNKDDVIHGVAGDSTTYYVRRDDEGAALDFSARSALKRTAVKSHTFTDSGAAYNQTQWDDNIHSGDVLVVPSEKVVGFLLEAWPCAVTKARGHLHGLTNPSTPNADEPEGWAAAREYANAQGWPLATSGDDYEAEPPSDDESHYSTKQAAELPDYWEMVYANFSYRDGYRLGMNCLREPDDDPSMFFEDAERAGQLAEVKLGFDDATNGKEFELPYPSVGLVTEGRKQAVEIFDRPSGGPRADVQWVLAVDNGMSKTWVTGASTMYEGRVSTTIEGAIAQYNGHFAGEYANVGRAKKAVEERIAKDMATKTSSIWVEVDGITTTEIGKVALTVVPERIGVAWAITSPDGETEYVTGKSRTVDSAKTAMLEHKVADIFGKDPDVANQTNPPKKKVKDDPDAVDEVEDEEDPDAVEDDAEDEFPLENGVEDQVETVDPMTLDVGDTLTVSYTMATGETGEVEGVFVRLEDDIAFFSGPNGEFGVAQRDGAWIDSEGNQFTFSFGSPDETGDTDPNGDIGDNPATPAEDPPVADAKDEGNTEYAADDDTRDKPKAKDDDGKKKKSQPPWLKGKGSTFTVQPGGFFTSSGLNTATPLSSATSIAYNIQPTTAIRTMAELVTAIGELAPNLAPEEIFGLAQQAMAASRERAGG
jgi:hypothetical protein